MSINTPAIIPKITAEQALRRLLTLIGASQSVADFTPGQLERVMGVPIERANDKQYGFGAPLTPQWDIGFGMDYITEGKNERLRFALHFIPNPPVRHRP